MKNPTPALRKPIAAERALSQQVLQQSGTRIRVVWKRVGEVEYNAAVRMPKRKCWIGRIGYHIRTGGCGLENYDWLRYLDFADKHWKGK